MGAVSDDPMPDRSMEHLDKVLWMIETNGWALEPVAARPELDPPRAAYAYSIGLEATFGFPEVVVFGQTPVHSRGIIGLVVDLLPGACSRPIGPLFLGLFDGEQRAALLPVDVDTHADLFDLGRGLLRRGALPHGAAHMAGQEAGGCPGSRGSSSASCSPNQSSAHSTRSTDRVQWRQVCEKHLASRLPRDQ